MTESLSTPVGVTLPPERSSSLHFAALIFDPDACVLKRQSGERIGLTRGELALLRAFLRQPGRVLSRDQLLDATAGRRAAPFDRSIDVLVGRLRRKIEADAKQPNLIATVPGEGYRFDAKPEPAEAARLADPVEFILQPGLSKQWASRNRTLLAAVPALCAALLGLAAWQWSTKASLEGGAPSIVVLPFENLSGDKAQDFLGASVAHELTTLLSTFPTLRVLAGAPAPGGSETGMMGAARAAGVRYVVQGGVHKLRDRLRFTAQLYDSTTGRAVWADRFDSAGVNPLELQEDVANRISDSLAGLHGRIRTDEERTAWSKAAPTLGEYDYYLRGYSLYGRFTVPDVLKARAVWQEGLDKYPGSALLRVKLAWSHMYVVMNAATDTPRDEIEEALKLADAADAAEPKSQLVTWLLHWLKAYLYQWHDNDFVRSVIEARAALELVPFDAQSRVDLSWIMANAGHGDEAVEWALMGVSHDPNGPSWYRSNLVWAYYIAARFDKAYDLLRNGELWSKPLLAVVCVRAGRPAEARKVIAEALAAGLHDTVALEGAWPLIEPNRTAYLNALREAGLPER